MSKVCDLGIRSRCAKNLSVEGFKSRQETAMLSCSCLDGVISPLGPNDEFKHMLQMSQGLNCIMEADQDKKKKKHFN